jgi:hypothetical protein
MSCAEIRVVISCGNVLCAAEDETSVDIMGRMFCCNFFAEKSIMTNLASEAIDARYGDCV